MKGAKNRLTFSLLILIKTLEKNNQNWRYYQKGKRIYQGLLDSAIFASRPGSRIFFLHHFVMSQGLLPRSV